eukprot:scaffold1850_cov194-Pinguiococcus_pyrenoidosus.AAC.48
MCGASHDTELASETRLTADFTFVARDINTKKAASVPQLQLETDEEKTVFEQVEKQQEARKRLRKMARKDDHMRVVADAAKKLLDKAAPLRNLPALADARHILLDATKLSNTFMTQPQQRNTAGRIFGGFLMRRAFELAYTTAYLFGGVRPRFEEVDEVSFHLPVDIGQLVQFESAVLYVTSPSHRTFEYEVGKGDAPVDAAALNEDPDSLLHCEPESSDGRPTAHIEVQARVIRPEHVCSMLSNTFHFTFSYDPDIADRIRLPLPSTQEEAIRVGR